MNANQNYRGDRIEEPIKGHPGIYRIMNWSERKQEYVDPRSIKGSRAKPFRAVKRVKLLGRWSKQQAMFDNLEEAKTWKQVSVGKTNQHKINTYTIGSLIQEWQEWSKHYLMASTCEQYAKEMQHLSALLKISVEDLRAEDIDAWIRHLIDPAYPKPSSRRSFEREVVTLTTILNWYRERKNPRYQPPVLRRHRRDAIFSKEPRQKKMALTEEQLEAVLERLKIHAEKKVYYYLAAFQALSGPRIGEACGLKWSDIDFHNAQYTIERIVWWNFEKRDPHLRNGTKTGEIRVVKLCPRLIRLLNEWKSIGEQGEFVFHNKGNLLRYPAIQNGYNKAFRALGLPHRSTHVFRHTFATLHADQTKDIRATQGALGHRDLRTTQHYAKVSELTQERALNDFRLGQIKAKENPCPAICPTTGAEVISFAAKKQELSLIVPQTVGEKENQQ